MQFFPLGQTPVWQSNATKVDVTSAYLAESLLFFRLAKTSRATYNSSLRVFFRWANSHNCAYPHFPEKPIPVGDLLNFIGFRFLWDAVTYATIKKDLFAIQNFHQEHNVNWRWRDQILLNNVMTAIAKHIGIVRDTRKPITVNLLEKMLSFLDASHFDELVVMACFTLAVYALLRVSEYVITTSYSKKNSPALKIKHISFFPTFNNPEFVKIRIENSKTDKTGNGFEVSVGKTGTKFCPVDLLQQMLLTRSQLGDKNEKLRIQKDNFLFVWKSGEPLDSKDIRLLLGDLIELAGEDKKYYSSHSFRIGGATTMIRKGIDAAVVKQLGRWTGPTYCLYSRLTLAELASYSKLMTIGEFDNLNKDKIFNFGKQL